MKTRVEPREERKLGSSRRSKPRRSTDRAELDESDTLDDGDPVELGAQYRELLAKLPWANVIGGCCGSDLRHVTEIARAIALSEAEKPPAGTPIARCECVRGS